MASFLVADCMINHTSSRLSSALLCRRCSLASMLSACAHSNSARAAVLVMLNKAQNTPIV
jgi:hypothetical protein